MNNVTAAAMTGFSCTCTHGGGGHVTACAMFVPTREQYAEVVAERDRLRAALRIIHETFRGLNDPTYGAPWWLK